MQRGLSLVDRQGKAVGLYRGADLPGRVLMTS
jgi:hypothetical protein